jgi:hypothetical protein
MNNNFTIFLISLRSYANEYISFQIYDSVEYISNKFESIFNIDLPNLYKNIYDIKSKNYISKNNLINKVFTFNKNNSKNIFKNQKNT